MLKSVAIKNYQSHRDSIIEFDKGVNVIVGPTDSGKSSIIRALRWVIWNRPTGEEFRSDWDGITSVCCKVDNIEIDRIRGKDMNTYVKGEGDEEFEFEAIRTEVPEEIQKIFNINEINLQQQHDNLFLLTNTPGEVAQHFNKIAHLELIDTSQKNIKGWLRDLKTTIDYDKTKLENAQQELKQYDYVDVLEADVETLEETEATCIQLYQDIRVLKDIVVKIEQCTRDVEELEAIMQDATLVDKVLAQFKQLHSIEFEIQKVRSLLVLIGDTAYKEVKLKDKIKILEEQFEQLMPKTCPLCGQQIKTK